MFPHPDPAPRTKVPVPYKATRAVLRVRTSSLWGHFPAPYTFVLPYAMPGVCSCHVEGGLTPGEEGVRALKAPVSADAGRAPDSTIIPAPPPPPSTWKRGPSLREVPRHACSPALHIGVSPASAGGAICSLGSLGVWGAGRQAAQPPRQGCVYTDVT